VRHESDAVGVKRMNDDFRTKSADFVKALWQSFEEAGRSTTESTSPEEGSADSFEGLLDGRADETLLTSKWDG